MGRVIAWAYNNCGQTNVPSEALTNIKAIAAGREHSLALTVEGSVIAWGGEQFTQVPPEATSDVVAIACGWYHSLALKSDGTIIGWGYKADIPSSLPTDIKMISAGELFSLAITQSGEVISWGEHACDIPEEAKTGIIKVSASKHMVVALTDTGKVIAWSPNGIETLSDEFQSGIKDIDAGCGCIYAVKEDGTILHVEDRCNRMYKNHHEDIPQVEVEKILAGADFTIAKKTDGTVVVWGQNWAGQCEIPTEVINPIALAVGCHHCLALVAES